MEKNWCLTACTMSSLMREFYRISTLGVNFLGTDYRICTNFQLSDLIPDEESGLYLLSFLTEVTGGLKAISARIKSLIVYILRLYRLRLKNVNLVSSVLLYTSHHEIIRACRSAENNCTSQSKRFRRVF